MSRYPQPAGERGSLKWIQSFVNECPQKLGSAIATASEGRIRAPINWLSPLENDDFAEYRDDAFLKRLGVEPSERELRDFWPRRGPQWDALANDDAGAPILVEAKANIPEIISSPTAAGTASKQRIDAALDEVASHLGVESTCDWSGTFYQYANRLAHLYFLHEVNSVDSWLIFVYFIGDSEVEGPKSEAEWKAGLEVLHGALGLTKGPPLLNRKVDVFLQVDD